MTSTKPREFNLSFSDCRLDPTNMACDVSVASESAFIERGEQISVIEKAAYEALERRCEEADRLLAQGNKLLGEQASLLREKGALLREAMKEISEHSRWYEQAKRLLDGVQNPGIES